MSYTVLEPAPATTIPKITVPKAPFKPTAPKVGQWSVFFFLALEKIVTAAEQEENNPEWLNLLYALISGSWDTNLNRRYRRRSCECCLIVSRRVKKYFESQRLDHFLDERALAGDDSMPRFSGNRKSRAN